MKPASPTSLTNGSTTAKLVIVATMLLSMASLLCRTVAADAGFIPASTGHENHGSNVVYAEWHTNYVSLQYWVEPNKTYTLQYLQNTITNMQGTNLQGASWIKLPPTSQQAPAGLPSRLHWEMRDFSVTNRSSTNLGRLYRVKVT